MSAYTQLLYQIVFCPKYRNPCMLKEKRQAVFAYIGGVIKNKKCVPWQINGIEDHLHILVKIHQTVPLASLVKDIKIASHLLIDEKGWFPDFTNCQSGYAAFSYDQTAMPNLMRYIQNQEEHHKSIDFKAEYISMLEEQNIDYDEKYLFD
jgi:putative transposase